jgi:predicted dehydrogenase
MRLAFIGGHGHHYLRLAVQNAPDAFTVAMAGDGFDNDAARNWSTRLPNAQWFDDTSTLFDKFQPDAVSIGAVYGHNGEIAALALEHDIAVVSDKPVAASWQQFQRLQELTQNNSRVLLTEFPFRSQPEFRAAQQAVASGKIGTVVLASAQKSYRFGASRPAWYGRRADYAGTMLWVASHGIDALRFCSGQQFERVIGIQHNLSRPDYVEMEDHCVALFEMQNGGSAMVHADFLRPAGAASHGDDRLRIAGSLGIVEVRDGRCRLSAGSDPEIDITDSVSVRPIESELLSVLRGEKSQWYSTEESLIIAEILLHTRDAADQRNWKKW